MQLSFLSVILMMRSKIDNKGFWAKCSRASEEIFIQNQLIFLHKNQVIDLSNQCQISIWPLSLVSLPFECPLFKETSFPNALQWHKLSFEDLMKQGEESGG